MYLNLAGNKITSIKPLQEVATVPNKLKSVDLSGNSLHDLRELPLLEKLTHLKSIIFHQDDEFTNPFCDSRLSYLEAIKNLALPSDAQIDNTFIPDLRFIRAESMGAPPPRNQQLNPASMSNGIHRPETAIVKRDVRRSDPQQTSIMNSRPPSRDRSSEGGQKNGQTKLSDARQNRKLGPSGGQGLQVEGRSLHRDIDLLDTSGDQDGGGDRVSELPGGILHPGKRAPAAQRQETFEEKERRELIQRDILEIRANKKLGQSQLSYLTHASKKQDVPPPLRKSALGENNIQLEFTKILLDNEKLKLELDDSQGKIIDLQEDRRYMETRLLEMEKAASKENSASQEIAKTTHLLRIAQEELEVARDSWENERRDREFKNKEIQEYRHREKEFSKRIEESITRAVEVSKENEDTRIQNQKANEEIANLNGQVAELRRMVKTYESNLNVAHNDSLKSNEIAIIRIEDLSSKLRDSDMKLSELKIQVAHLQDSKNDIFQDKVKLEASLTNQLESMKLSHSSAISLMEENHKKVLSTLTINHKEELARERSGQDAALNGLESEYRAIVSTANDKYKKVIDESRSLREALRSSMARNREVESVLDDMTKVVETVKQQYREVKSKLESTDPDGAANAYRDIETLKSKLQAEEDVRVRIEKESSSLANDVVSKKDELKQKEEELEGFRGKLFTKEAEISDLKKEITSKNKTIDEYSLKLQNIEHRFEVYENQAKDDEMRLISEIEDLNTEVRIKSQLLTEKSSEIEKLKSELDRKAEVASNEAARRMEVEDTWRAKVENEQLEYQKLRSKYQKKDELLDEYEAQIEGLQSEVERSDENVRRLRIEIESKGKVAEECYEKVKQMQMEKRAFEDHQSISLRELERNIDNLNQVIKTKDNRIRELERGLREVEETYKDIVTQLERKNRELSSECHTREKEIKTLLYEIDNQKKLAKENLANLTKIFS